MKDAETTDETGEISSKMFRRLADIPEGPPPGLNHEHKARTFPLLYKRSNTGAMQIWRIYVADTVIYTTYGQLGGAMQSTEDGVKQGKNSGKKNATTPAQQAVLEAASRWRKKKEREGYVEDRARAERGETDALGGIAPMLAQPRADAEKHILFPIDAQYKYNGIRCIAVVEDGKVGLWSRKRQQILGVPHIQTMYERAFMGVRGRYVFDGEIYRHGWSLQKIGGFVRKTKETKEGYEELNHFVYDLPEHGGVWADRKAAMEQLQGLGLGAPVIHWAETFTLNNLPDIKRLHDEAVLDGYEGIILRNLAAPYEAGKRSYNLIKVKEFKEQEFTIVGVTEGRGRMEGKAIFICETEAGKQFEVVAPGTMKDKEEFLQRGPELFGKPLTVKFLEWTEDGKPSHAVARAVRDYE